MGRDDAEDFDPRNGRPPEAGRDVRRDDRAGGGRDRTPPVDRQERRREQREEAPPPRDERRPPKPERDERPAGKEPAKKPATKSNTGEAVFSRAQMRRLKPAVRRNMAFFLMALTLVSNWFGAGGYQQTESKNFFAMFFAQFTLVGAITGSIAFGIITFFQWIWAEDWRGKGWLIVTFISTALFVKGFWWIGVPPVERLLTTIMRGETPPVPLVNGTAVVFLGIISLIIDIWPEQVLVARD